MSLVNLTVDNNKKLSIKGSQLGIDSNPDSSLLSILSNRSAVNRVLIQADKEQAGHQCEVGITRNNDALLHILGTDVARIESYGSGVATDIIFYVDGKLTSSANGWPNVTVLPTESLKINNAGISILGGPPFSFISESLATNLQGNIAPTPITLKLQKFGDLVSCRFVQTIAAATGGALFLTLSTLLPATYRPSVIQKQSVRVMDNSNRSVGTCYFYNTGLVEIYVNANTAFAPTANCGILDCTCSYMV